MKRMLMMSALVVGLGVLPLAAIAAEHGGQEHGGAAEANPTGGEHAHSAEETAATLHEAADALRATRPDLADKLEHLAESYEQKP